MLRFRKLTGSLVPPLMSLGVFLLYLWFVTLRFGSPFDIDNAESCLFQALRHFAGGGWLYQEPSPSYATPMYGPLHFWLAWLVSLGAGVGLQTLRFTSLVATGGCLVLLYLFSRRESGDARLAFLAPGVFLASSGAAGYALDTARVDATLLFFLLAFAYGARFATNRPGLLLTAFAGTLACLTKVTAIPFILILLFWYRWVKKPFTSLFVGATFSFTASAMAATNWWYDGWYWFYNFTLPMGHVFSTKAFLSFWFTDLFSIVGIETILCVSLIVFLRKKKRPRDGAFWLFLVAASVFSVLPARIHSGGGNNVLLPVYMIFALGASVALAIFWRQADRRLSLLFLGVSVFCFFKPRFFPIEVQTQGKQDERERVVEFLKASPFSYYVPVQSDIVKGLGREFAADWLIVEDLLRCPRAKQEQDIFRSKMNRYLSDTKPDVVVTTMDSYFAGTKYATFMKEILARDYTPISSEHFPVKWLSGHPLQLFRRK